MNFFGILGSFFSSITYIPQLYTTYKYNNTSGLSIWLLLLAIVATICWLIYAIQLNLTFLIFSNTVSLIVLVCLLIIFIQTTTINQ